MIRQVAPRMARKLESRRSPLEQAECARMILVVEGNGRARIPSHEHVMNGPWAILSPRSRHAATIAYATHNDLRRCATSVHQWSVVA